MARLTAADAADRLGPPVSRGWGTTARPAVVLAAWTAQLLAMRLEFEEARTLYEHALKTARELGQPVLAAQLAFNAGEVELRAGMPREPSRSSGTRKASSSDVGDSFFLASVAAMRGQALLELGQREEASAEAARARDLAAEDDLDALSRDGGVSSRLSCSRRGER